MGSCSPFSTLGETVQKINLGLMSEECRGLTVGQGFPYRPLIGALPLPQTKWMPSGRRQLRPR